MSAVVTGRAAAVPGVVLAAVVALALTPSTATAAQADADRDPLRRAPVFGTDAEAVVPGNYIVVLREQRAAAGASSTAARQAIGAGGRVTHQYGSTLEGFAAHLPARAVEALRTNPDVAYIEADQRVSASTTQYGPTWGLDRIDQRGRRVDGSYTYDRTGTGVTAYVIDTGVQAEHAQFGGRVLGGFTAVADGRGTADCNGHGTHVAGTVGGRTYGVAKRVTIRPVRVLNCQGSGTMSKVIAGIDWVTGHHAGSSPAVANMSLGAGASPALDAAVARSIADGVSYVVAAGNEGEDACGSSPARAPAAVTVAATTKQDARAPYSNFGPCVDLFAPGSGITSAWPDGKRATQVLSGTSMAAPHVAGAAALYLQAYPSAPPAAVGRALASTGTAGVLAGRGAGSPDRLLFSRVDSAPVSPPVPPPGTENLLQNPGFESGPVGWDASGDLVSSGRDVPARTGSWKARLGGHGVEDNDTLAQVVSIPAAPSASLSLHVDVRSEEPVDMDFDYLRVEALVNGKAVNVGLLSNRHQSGSFVRHDLDMSRFTGRTITLRFTSVEDASLATSFVIDDTELVTG